MGLLSFRDDPEMMKEFCPESADTFKVASEWKLSDVFEKKEYRSNTNLGYEYDHGDSWEHVITFAGVEDPGLRKALMQDAEYGTPLCFAGEVCRPSETLFELPKLITLTSGSSMC